MHVRSCQLQNPSHRKEVGCASEPAEVTAPAVSMWQEQAGSAEAEAESQDGEIRFARDLSDMWSPPALENTWVVAALLRIEVQLFFSFKGLFVYLEDSYRHRKKERDH